MIAWSPTTSQGDDWDRPRPSCFAAQQHAHLSVWVLFIFRASRGKLAFDDLGTNRTIASAAVFSFVNAGVCCNIKVFNVNTVDLAAKCAAALGASKLVYIADGSYLEDTLTGVCDSPARLCVCVFCVCDNPVCLIDGAEHISIYTLRLSLLSAKGKGRGPR